MLVLLLLSCVLDRTGQSATEVYRRQLVIQGTRVSNLENLFEQLELRVVEMEELVRDRGQSEVLKLENMEQLRNELARVRGDLEVLQHDYEQITLDSFATDEEMRQKLAWMELRAAKLEKAVGLKTPPMPEPGTVAEVAPVEGEGAVGEGEGTTAGEGAGEGEDLTERVDVDDTVTEPEAMMKLAEEHLAAGRNKAAEVVLARFIKLHPNNPRIPEARYRYAEARFNAADYQAAVLRFQDVIDRHRDSSWASWAMLRQGECFAAQNRVADARFFYEDVIRLWPKSEAAKEAKALLKD